MNRVGTSGGFPPVLLNVAIRRGQKPQEPSPHSLPATEGLQVTKSFCGALSAFFGCRIQQQPPLVAALSHAVPAQVQIGKSNCGGNIPFCYRLPKPTSGFPSIAGAQIFLRQT